MQTPGAFAARRLVSHPLGTAGLLVLAASLATAIPFHPKTSGIGGDDLGTVAVASTPPTTSTQSQDEQGSRSKPGTPGDQKNKNDAGDQDGKGSQGKQRGATEDPEEDRLVLNA